jgi:hypothetical protein
MAAVNGSRRFSGLSRSQDGKKLEKMIRQLAGPVGDVRPPIILDRAVQTVERLIAEGHLSAVETEQRGRKTT